LQEHLARKLPHVDEDGLNIYMVLVP